MTAGVPAPPRPLVAPVAVMAAMPEHPVPRHPRLLRTALLVGAVIGMADATIVAVALDPLGRHFGQSLATSQAVLSVYLVVVTASLPLTGRLGDRMGRRTVYLAGFAVFAAGSVLAATAPGFGVLLAGRAVQALGGGMLTSGSLALLAQHTPRHRTGRGVALLVVAQAIAGIAAPPLGGLLVALFGWQGVFWAGLPIAVAAFGLTLAVVPADLLRGREIHLDVAGAAGLGALLLGAGAALGATAGDALLGLGPLPWLGVALAGLSILVIAEPRVTAPILDASLLRGRFGGATLATFLSTGSLMSCFALLPFWLEHAHGASALLAGVAFLPIGLGIGAASSRAGRLADAGHTRRVTTLGMSVAATGLGLAAVAALTDLWPLLVLGLLVMGLGNGLFSSPNTAAAISMVPRTILSSAAGLLSTARNAGVVVGLGATGAAYTAMERTGERGRADAAAALLFGAAAVICLVVAALAARLHAGVAADPE